MLKSYIIILKDTALESDVDEAIANIEAAGGELIHRYNSNFMSGFAADIPESHLQELQASHQTTDSKISHIELDTVMEADQSGIE